MAETSNGGRRTAAVAYTRNLPIDEPDALFDTEITVGEPHGSDLLVDVRAVSVNPVDTKLRRGRDTGGEPTVLGYDAAGTVLATGSDVRLFRPGDEVYYAGVFNRPGSNAGLQLVNEHIVGHKPTTLGFAEAAAMPLTSLTAWETLFDKLALTADSAGTLLVLGGAGGVGSMVIQLARALTPGVRIVATGSRTESADWARDLGAHQVISHDRLLDELGEDSLDYVFSPYTAGRVETFTRLLRPRGQVVAIDEPEGLDLLGLKQKSQSWHWEFMFTKPVFEPDNADQHEALERIRTLLDQGSIRHTMTTHLGRLNAANLIEAHRKIESGHTIGKIVLDVDAADG